MRVRSVRSQARSLWWRVAAVVTAAGWLLLHHPFWQTVLVGVFLAVSVVDLALGVVQRRRDR
ncbi:hypothetical protein OHV05_33615 [Kitasatospora sp. NBC_00070]|uniref:hypothetical protein n=1 Tax=Kitasatospora sp. NBC_00070 TaxID=2975962 RepID=UPI003244CEA0